MPNNANRNPLITQAQRRALWDSPCVVCAESGDIEIDHVVPVALGGINDATNLQPLCRVCNAIKGARMTNDQLREWIANNPAEHARRKHRRKINRQLSMRGAL
jgi:5-methylcytosine-specific restriction endonuclease McrA